MPQTTQYTLLIRCWLTVCCEAEAVRYYIQVGTLISLSSRAQEIIRRCSVFSHAADSLQDKWDKSAFLGAVVGVGNAVRCFPTTIETLMMVHCICLFVSCLLIRKILMFEVQVANELECLQNLKVNLDFSNMLNSLDFFEKNRII